MNRRGLAAEIVPLLEQKLTTDEIVARLGCAKSYVRAVKSRHCTSEIDDLMDYEDQASGRVRHRADANARPLQGNQLERAERLHKAGFSAWEIAQAIPEVKLCLR